jgi:hypothetical protein
MTGCVSFDLLQKTLGEDSALESRADQEPRSGRRCEGNGHGEFRVIVASNAGVGLGPGEIKHEFAVRMAFDVGRRRRRQSRLIEDCDVGGVPACAGTYAVSMLQGREKLVSQEGVSISTQGIPLPRVELVNAVMNA